MQSNPGTAGDRYHETVDIRLCRALQSAALPAALIFSLTVVSTQRCVAQTQSSAPTNMAAVHDSDSDKTVRAGDETDNAPGKTAPAPSTWEYRPSLDDLMDLFHVRSNHRHQTTLFKYVHQRRFVFLHRCQPPKLVSDSRFASCTENEVQRTSEHTFHTLAKQTV